MTRIIYFILSCCLILSCTSNKEDDNIIARYGDKILLRSDLKGLLPTGSSTQDSIFIIENYTDKWIKNQVFLKEALDSKVLDLSEIEAKTLEYKNALIIYEYQKGIIAQKLDTSVSEDEYKSFYKQHEKDFELKQNIVKGIMIKVRGKSYGLQRLAKEINRLNDCDKSIKPVEAFSRQFGETYTVETQNWITFDALIKATPFIKIQNKTDWLSRSNWGILEEDGYAYYIKICDCKLENRISPIDYIKEQIKSIILNSRKVKLLEEYEEEIYKKALSEKQIEKFN